MFSTQKKRTSRKLQKFSILGAFDVFSFIYFQRETRDFATTLALSIPLPTHLFRPLQFRGPGGGGLIRPFPPSRLPKRPWGRVKEEGELQEEAERERRLEIRPQLNCPDGQFNKFGQIFFTDLSGALRRMVVLGHEVPNTVICPAASNFYPRVAMHIQIVCCMARDSV